LTIDSALVTERNVAASTQNQALHALRFLYERVRNIELENRDKRRFTPQRLQSLNRGGRAVQSPLEAL
jgi:hypothetical protein